MLERRRDRTTTAVAVAVGVVGVLLVAWSAARVDGYLLLLVVVLAGAASELLPAQLRPGMSVSLVNVVAFTAVLLGGPELAIAAAVGSVVPGYRSYARPRPLRAAFNVGQLALAALAAGSAYQAIAPPGAQHLLDGGRVAELASPIGALALATTALVFTLVNFGLVATMIALVSGERVGNTLRSALPAVGLQPMYLGLSVLAAVLVVDVHPAAIVLLVIPAAVARTGLAAFQREAEAYDELVLALVKLIEVKDGYTRGHAERVALLAVEMATELGYDYDRRRTTRYAALLHDVGKIAVPTAILRKPAALSDEEYVRVQTHPEVGVELLADIDFLAEARPGIVSHHERIDGRGYPHRLSGDQIPELARLLTVVDAFDAMTSTRAYRNALDVGTAVGRIRAGAGTQFDPEMVARLERVLARVEWQPTHAPSPAAASSARALLHLATRAEASR